MGLLLDARPSRHVSRQVRGRCTSPPCIDTSTLRSHCSRYHSTPPLVVSRTLAHPWLRFACAVAHRSLCIAQPSVAPVVPFVKCCIPVPISSNRRRRPYRLLYVRLTCTWRATESQPSRYSPYFMCDRPPVSSHSILSGVGRSPSLSNAVATTLVAIPATNTPP